jgi:hypothetical protein
LAQLVHKDRKGRKEHLVKVYLDWRASAARKDQQALKVLLAHRDSMESWVLPGQ